MGVPLNIDWQQILLHLMNFAILAGGLYFLLYKPVKDFMDKRAAHYKEMEEEAAKKISDADELRDSYQKQLEDVRAEIEKERNEARRENEAEAKKQIEEARKQAEKIIAEARAEAERDSEKTLHDSQEAMKELVAAATERLMIKNDDKAIDMFLDSVERGQQHEPEG